MSAEDVKTCVHNNLMYHTNSCIRCDYERVNEYVSWFVRTFDWRDFFDMSEQEIDLIRLEVEANGSHDYERETFFRCIDKQKIINEELLR